MPNFLNSVTLLSDNAEAARAPWTRLGFALSPGGVIAFENATLTLRDAAEPGPAFGLLSLAMTERPNAPVAPARHPNGVRALAALAKALENPADHAEALGRAANQREMRATSAGLELKLANARLEALTPAAFGQLYGETAEALVFAADLDAARAFFTANAIAFEERFGRFVIAGPNLTLAFEAQEPSHV
jgi:catechol 2,3-dioxygenase-like lactoylglutathione lyase family enzyme